MAETDATSDLAPVSSNDAASRDRSGKSPSAFRTISEAADELGLQQHVLRFWESKFPQVKPLKRGGGRRYYRPEDIALLTRIRDWLHVEGYTIKGVQKLLRDPAQRNGSGNNNNDSENHVAPLSQSAPAPATDTTSNTDLDQAIERLSGIRTNLLKVLGE